MNELTNKEKLQRGTLKKSRVKSCLSYEPLKKVPRPAFGLSHIGMDYFSKFCKILISIESLTMADVPGITRAARWYEIYKEAENDIIVHGSVQVTSTGYTQQTGYFSVMEKAEDRILKFEALYGMNLTARTKINLPKPEKKNPFDDI